MTFFGVFEKISYPLEILLGEFLFLHGAFPRRRQFPLRFLLTALTVVFGCSYTVLDFFRQNQVLMFGSYLFTLGLSILGMFFCYRGTFWAVFATCSVAVACQHISHHLSRIAALFPQAPAWSPYLEFGCCLAVYGFMAWIYARNKKSQLAPDAHITRVSMLMILLCIGVTRLLRKADTADFYVVLSTSIYAILCCTMAIYIQFALYRRLELMAENLVLSRIQEEQRLQYESTKENRLLLNIKCHDLKHKLSSFEESLPKAEVDSMKAILDDYEGTYRTGYDTLDIVLNEKNNRCRSKGINLTFSGNGDSLSFLETMDAYALFGNILDNAITAAEALTDPKKKVITLTAESKGNFVHVSAINYAQDVPLHFIEGLPGTTKDEEAGWHGFGLKSVRRIAREHGGDVSVSFENGVFILDIYMMKA